MIDAAVIGAGPAGSLAALLLARAGLSVTLIDRARFPRDKVCGCCLSAASISTLSAVGLDRITHHAPPLTALHLSAGRARVTLPITSKSLSRSAFDYALVQAAVAEGVTFLSQTVACVDDQDRIELRAGLEARPSIRTGLDARAILIADGLAGTSLRGRPSLSSAPSRNARIGLSTILPAETPGFSAHSIHMAIARRGYVGAVRLEDHRLNIAAAMDPRLLRESGTPGAAVASIYAGANIPTPNLEHARFTATPALTRRRRTIQRGRLFILGDAAGYVEPFTGEGIAWAMACATAIVPHILDHLGARAVRWQRTHRRVIAPRQRLCRALAWTLRHPFLTSAAIHTLALLPSMATPALRRAASPFQGASA